MGDAGMGVEQAPASAAGTLDEQSAVVRSHKKTFTSAVDSSNSHDLYQLAQPGSFEALCPASLRASGSQSTTIFPEETGRAIDQQEPADPLPMQSANMSDVCTPGPDASAEQVAKLASRDLLRAAPMSVLLARFGDIWANKGGSAATYELSQIANSIDEFISHNWCTPRWMKYLALAVHYNTITAITCSWVVGLLVALATAFGWLPALPNSPWKGAPSVVWSMNAQILGQFAFYMGLMYGHHLRGALGLRVPSVFVDKVCIHQTDSELKRQGISSLAGFLRESKQMTVVFTDFYLTRLWTVYEVASFLVLHGPTRIILLFASIAIFVALMNSIILLFGASMILPGLTGLAASPGFRVRWVQEMVDSLITSLTFLGPILMMRHWHRKVNTAMKQIASFSVRNSACAVEADRALVEENIAKLVRLYGFVRREASNEEALDAFDVLVQRQLPHAMWLSFGRNLLPLRIAVGMTMGFLLYGLDAAAVQVRASEPWTKALAEFLTHAVWPLGGFPICAAVSSRLMGTKLELRGLAEVCHVTLRATLVYAVASLIVFPDSVLRMLTQKSVGGVAIGCAALYLTFLAALLCVATYLYRPPHKPADAVQGSRSSEGPP